VAYLLRGLLTDGSVKNLNRETVFYKVPVANVATQRSATIRTTRDVFCAVAAKQQYKLVFCAVGAEVI
jgi:hypothetical protein